MSTTKSAAPKKLLTLTENDVEMIIATDAEVDVVLAASLRAPSQYGELASHRTQYTRKYQVMAAIPYEDCLKVLIKKGSLPSEAAAIRIVFEQGLRAMGFGAVVEAARDEQDEDGEAE